MEGTNVGSVGSYLHFPFAGTMAIGNLQQSISQTKWMIISVRLRGIVERRKCFDRFGWCHGQDGVFALLEDPWEILSLWATSKTTIIWMVYGDFIVSSSHLYPKEIAPGTSGWNSGRYPLPGYGRAGWFWFFVCHLQVLMGMFKFLWEWLLL